MANFLSKAGQSLMKYYRKDLQLQLALPGSDPEYNPSDILLI